jgi:hypothetical protein
MMHHGIEPFEVGHDSIPPVSPDYKGKGGFAFAGRIEKITFLGAMQVKTPNTRKSAWLVVRNDWIPACRYVAAVTPTFASVRAGSPLHHARSGLPAFFCHLYAVYRCCTACPIPTPSSAHGIGIGRVGDDL